jgi:hypothetical protein
MKTLLLATALFIAVAETRGKEIQFSAGMTRTSAVKTLQELAEDISGQLEVTGGPNGEPPKEFCWELRDYDLVVWLYGKANGNILSFGYWTKKAFRQPKLERYNQEGIANRITLDTEKHAYRVEKFPRYFPAGTFAEREQAWLDPILFAAKEPVLSMKGKDKDYFALRLLYLPGRLSDDSRPGVAVRYEKKGNRFIRRSVALSDAAFGKTAKPQEFEVPKLKIEILIAALEKTGFWTMPKDDPVDAVSQYPGQDNTGKDSSRIIVEVVRNGVHRVRARWGLDYQTKQRGLSALVKLYTDLFQEAGVWKRR